MSPRPSIARLSSALRRVFFSWLLPAAVVLPVWMFVGWLVSGASGWMFLWVVLVAMPATFVGQLIATALVRLRPSVRVARMVSWSDLGVIGLWQAVCVVLALLPQTGVAPLMLAAGAAYVLLVVSRARLLWTEARGALRQSVPPVVVATASPGEERRRRERSEYAAEEMIVLRETRLRD